MNDKGILIGTARFIFQDDFATLVDEMENLNVETNEEMEQILESKLTLHSGL